MGRPSSSSSTHSSAAIALAQRDEIGERSGPGGRATVGQRADRHLLALLQVEGELGPAPRAVEALGPRPAQPLAAEVAVGAQGVVALAVQVEQREAALGRVGGVQAGLGSPDRAGVVAAEAVQQAADGAEVPAGAGAHVGLDQRERGTAGRPPHPARRERLDRRDGRNGVGGGEGVRAARVRDGQAAPGRDGEGQRRTAADTGRRELADEDLWERRHSAAPSIGEGPVCCALSNEGPLHRKGRWLVSRGRGLRRRRRGGRGRRRDARRASRTRG